MGMGCRMKGQRVGMGWTVHPMAIITPGIRVAWGWGLETHPSPTLGLCCGGCYPLGLRDGMWVLLGQHSGARWGFAGLGK